MVSHSSPFAGCGRIHPEPSHLAEKLTTPRGHHVGTKTIAEKTHRSLTHGDRGVSGLHYGRGDEIQWRSKETRCEEARSGYRQGQDLDGGRFRRAFGERIGRMVRGGRRAPGE